MGSASDLYRETNDFAHLKFTGERFIKPRSPRDLAIIASTC